MSSNGEQSKCNSCQDLLEYLGQKVDDLDNCDNNLKEDIKMEDSYDYNLVEDEDKIEEKPKIISFSQNVTGAIKIKKKQKRYGVNDVCPYCNVSLSHGIFRHVQGVHREKLEHYGENYAVNKGKMAGK